METVARFTPSASPFAHLGPAHAVAYDHRAPADEVEDAGRMLMKAYHGEGLPQQASFAAIVRDVVRLKEAERMGERLLVKALKMVNPEAAEEKATTEAWDTKVRGGGKWVEKPGAPFDALEQILPRLEVAQAIHLTRQRQIAALAEPSSKVDMLGFRISPLDPDAVWSPEQSQFASWLQKFILNCGREFRPVERRKARRVTFRTFLAQLLHDTYKFDHVAMETVKLQASFGLDHFAIRDSSTFRFSVEPSGDNHVPYAYQIGMRGAGQAGEIPFEADELAIFQRNVSPSLKACGYGRSELEMSLDTLASFISAINYTREGLDQNAIPRGMLAISGNYNRQEKLAFQAAWDAKVRGVGNRFGLPVLFSQGQQAAASFIQTGQPFSEMAFVKWIGFNSAILGGVYGIDPSEIGMEGFSSDKSSLSGSDTKARLDLAKNQGLVPLVAAVEGFLSDEVVGRWVDWARLEFTGLQNEDEQAKRELLQRVSTINELRAAQGLEPHPLGWFGDLPADPQLMSAEFQRLSAVGTLNEGRSFWGGLPKLPSDLLGNTPLNPSMGASYQNALAAAAPDAPDADGGEGDDASKPGDPWQEAGDALKAQKPTDDGQGLSNPPEEADGASKRLKDGLADLGGLQ